MNRYINLKRIEFVITNACSGRCKHCSSGERLENNGNINADAAAAAVERLADRFAIKSIMTFGGEPLLFSDTVCKIHAIARDCGIPKRQLITSGFFSEDSQRICDVAKDICNAGVTDTLLSVDVFHQEFIPIDPVIEFAEALLRHGIPSLMLNPAWVVNEENNNCYNAETKRLLKIFTDKGIRTHRGNNITPSGNALKHLAEYFVLPTQVDLSVPCGSAPFTSKLDDIDCISIKPSGDVYACSSIGNIYEDDIMSIIDSYDPYNNPALRAVLDGGVVGLINFAEKQGVKVDISNCRSACGMCRKIMDAVKDNKY